MGVLTDFVVMNRRDAKKVLKAANPARDFSGLDAKGIDTIKLGALHAILTETDWSPGFMDETLCHGGQDGPWVFEVPTELVLNLASLNARKLNSVAKKWAKTEEFSPEFDNWPTEAVLQVLQELSALCKRAVQVEKAVLMWTSL